MVVELQYVKLDSTYISSCNPIIPFYLDQSELPPSSLSFYRSPSYGSHVLRMSDKVILPCRSIDTCLLDSRRVLTLEPLHFGPEQPVCAATRPSLEKRLTDAYSSRTTLALSFNSTPARTIASAQPTTVASPEARPIYRTHPVSQVRQHIASPKIRSTSFCPIPHLQKQTHPPSHQSRQWTPQSCFPTTTGRPRSTPPTPTPTTPTPTTPTPTPALPTSGAARPTKTGS